MTHEPERWDPSLPSFVTDVLKTTAGLGALLIVVGGALHRSWLSGLVAGVLLAFALLLIARAAGRQLGQGAGCGRILAWLLFQQFILWVGLAFLLNVVKVDTVGFLLGVGVLPAAIIATLIWYSLHRRQTPS